MMKNNIAFPFISAILVMVFSCKDLKRKKSNIPNNLKNTHWIVNAGGLIKPDGEKTYYLSPRVDTALIFNFHAINFLDEETFISYDAGNVEMIALPKYMAGIILQKLTK